MLLCASAINYMDRQALASASVRITQQFHLTLPIGLCSSGG